MNGRWPALPLAVDASELLDGPEVADGEAGSQAAPSAQALAVDAGSSSWWPRPRPERELLLEAGDPAAAFEVVAAQAGGGAVPSEPEIATTAGS